MNEDYPEWLSLVWEKVRNLRYGVVQIVVHDSKVTQIERTERTRIVSSETTKARVANQPEFNRPDTLEVS